MKLSPVSEWAELPLVLSVPHVAKVLGIGRNAAYNLIHHDGFPHVRIAGKIRVPRDALVRWLEAKAKAG